MADLSPDAESRTTPPAAPPAATRSGWRARWLTVAALGAPGLCFIVLGYEGRRVAQLLTLLLPLLLWLRMPLRTPVGIMVRRWLVTLGILVFVLDGVARTYLLSSYQAAPDSTLVLSAMANTNLRESLEYAAQSWRGLALFGLVLAAVAAWIWLVSGKLEAVPAPGPGRKRSLMDCAVLVLIGILLLLSAAAYANKPWRRLHPVLFWPHWVESTEKLRKGWANLDAVRNEALERAQAAAPVVLREGPSTVVLVLTDSINRDNFSLYGYGRKTTPGLQQHQRQLGAQMQVLRNAWSVDAATLPAIGNLFSFGMPEADDAQHLLALARVAGYKVWWISNHDDVAIEQQHARHADVLQMINREPGRSSMSLDGELLDEFHTALQAPDQRKFIVVHMQGAHPHYSLRFPKGHNPFDDADDAVDAAMARQGRPVWVRELRQNYDAAVLYHDSVVSELLRLSREADRPQAYTGWMYLSDHGQEVGHVGNHVGHSPGTAAGYRIPAIVWQSHAAAPIPTDWAQRPFRADWAAWTLADLLGVQWHGQQVQHNVLHADYRWQAPQLPQLGTQLPSFTD
ncbi:phosphoethanolamine transferase [Comamonas sp. UBA7528]|uniref:phosphoethanolamine transferase n=1 Tax=Comamonas sp. UBA7528 TaxID=1946391 RepID=UPI0025BEAA9D|nr:phosphoethanolamine transferase [Comamonas sp. UBA7528]